MKRRNFIKTGLMGTAAISMAPTVLLSRQDCNVTNNDILGPYWAENHPYRVVLANIDEPGTRIHIAGTVKANDCETPIQNAIVDVWHANQDLIIQVASRFHVDPFLIITIAGIESNYGVHHSQFSVFNSLYTQIHEMPRRSKWATKELAEFLKFCFDDQLDPQEIGGSYAGAFGYGQFIPSSFNNFSVDFDEDGVRQPYAWPDVLGSIANYLRRNGHNPSSTNYEKNGDIWKSVYAYNHSNNYVMAVLELREKIQERVLSEQEK